LNNQTVWEGSWKNIRRSTGSKRRKKGISNGYRCNARQVAVSPSPPVASIILCVCVCVCVSRVGRVGRIAHAFREADCGREGKGVREMRLWQGCCPKVVVKRLQP